MSPVISHHDALETPPAVRGQDRRGEAFAELRVRRDDTLDEVTAFATVGEAVEIRTGVSAASFGTVATDAADGGGREEDASAAVRIATPGHVMPSRRHTGCGGSRLATRPEQRCRRWAEPAINGFERLEFQLVSELASLDYHGQRCHGLVGRGIGMCGKKIDRLLPLGQGKVAGGGDCGEFGTQFR